MYLLICFIFLYERDLVVKQQTPKMFVLVLQQFSVSFSIFLLDPAKIIKRQDNTAQVGGYASLICQSEGNPTPVITWTRDKTNEIVGYGSTLVFCPTQFYDGGWYKCSSENSLGKDRANVYLEVIGKNDYSHVIQPPTGWLSW